MLYREVTLYNVIQRIVTYQHLLEENPEATELLTRKINEAKQYALEILIKNSNNNYLKYID